MEVDILTKLRRKQYEHFESFTLMNNDDLNLTSIPRNHKYVIAKVVGYGMFGAPKFVRTSSHQPAYSKEQDSKIWPVVDKIIKLSPPGEDVKFSCIFLVCHQNNEVVNVPVFRIQTKSGIMFIDSFSWQYADWNTFLKSNTLTDVIYCYPSNGRYIKAEGFNVAFSTGPGSKILNKIMEIGDMVGQRVVGVYNSIRSHSCIILLYFINFGLMNPAHILTVLGQAFAEQVFFEFVTKASSHKMLFYFGTASSKNALSLIRKSLKLQENQSKVKTLLALLENNCIQIATGTGEVKLEKYVSNTKAELMTDILTTISSEILDVVMDHCNFLGLFQIYKDKMIVKEEMADKVGSVMINLLGKVNDEIKILKAHLKILLCQDLEMSKDLVLLRNMILDFMDTEGGLHLLLAFRLLIWSHISEIRKANNFFNNIEHKALTLKGHHFGDVWCHPLGEISRQVKERIEQSESAVDFKAIDKNELEYLVSEILILLEPNCKPNWSVHQLALCLINITKYMVSGFGRIVNQHKDVVKQKGKISCNDLETITEEIGLEGYDYGTWVSKKVINELKADVTAIKNMTVGTLKTHELSLTPAWGGVLHDLYHYYIETRGLDKFSLIEQIQNINLKNYIKEEVSESLTILKPSNEASTDQPTFVVYSSIHRSRIEEGFIWLYKRSIEQE